MPSDGSSPAVLFTGYAPVHFACFRPLYERLLAEGCEVYLSGGLRSKTEDGWRYDAAAMYGPLGIPAENILSLAQIKERAFDFLFAANTKMIQPDEVRTKVQIFHGVSFRNRAARDDNAGCDYYFIVGPYMRRKFAEIGIVEQDDPRGVPVGFMKTDRLLDGSLSRDEMLRHYGFDGSRPVLLYAPTGEKHNSLETMGEKVLTKLAATGRFDILIKLHDHPKNKLTDWPARLAPMEDDHLTIVRDFDVILPLFSADLLITDASSVSNEYALLDRPMVFLDVPKLLKVANRREGAMVDLETWGRKCGPIVERSGKIVSVVEESLGNPHEYSEVRKAMAADLFFNPGRATQAAMDWFGAIASQRSR